jgi:hypothetical protein
MAMIGVSKLEPLGSMPQTALAPLYGATLLVSKTVALSPMQTKKGDR